MFRNPCRRTICPPLSRSWQETRIPRSSSTRCSPFPYLRAVASSTILSGSRSACCTMFRIRLSRCQVYANETRLASDGTVPRPSLAGLVPPNYPPYPSTRFRSETCCKICLRRLRSSTWPCRCNFSSARSNRANRVSRTSNCRNNRNPATGLSVILDKQTDYRQCFASRARVCV